jgi:hypothetical protein
MGSNRFHIVQMKTWNALLQSMDKRLLDIALRY